MRHWSITTISCLWDIKMKLLFIFINALFSITNAKYESDGLDNEINLERRSGGLYSVMFKPYVLELLNSRAVSKLKKTTCWKNLHFLTTNDDLHYLSKLPISRALFTSRIPQFQKWLLNLRRGPSVTKGIFIILRWVQSSSAWISQFVANISYNTNYLSWIEVELLELC